VSFKVALVRRLVEMILALVAVGRNTRSVVWGKWKISDREHSIKTHCYELEVPCLKLITLKVSVK
jgi:hypothetical protein